MLVGASLGGMASLLAIGEADEPIARALVLVDVAPTIEQVGAQRIGDFMAKNMETGFASLERGRRRDRRVQPAPATPKDLDGLRKNVRAT